METFINAPASENCSVTRTENFKIRTATTIHPNAIIVIAPRAVLRAGAAAALFDETNTPTGIGGAIVALAVLGGTVERSNGSAARIRTMISTVRKTSYGNFEIGAAAVIHPNAAHFAAPRAALDTFGFTAAPNEANGAVRTRVAEVAVHIVGRAGDVDVVLLVFLVVLIAADFEIGAATAIHPNSAIVIAPSSAVDAVGFTALAEEPNAAASVSLAGMPVHIVRRAGHGLRRAAVAGRTQFKVSAATLIHPNAATVVTPSATENAFRTAALTGEAYAVADARRAKVAITFIGGAVDGIAVVPTVPRSTADLKFGAAAAVNPNAVGVVTPGSAEDAR